MAVVKAIPYVTGKLLRGVIRDQLANRYWNPTIPGFEPFNNANVANYGLAMTEEGLSGNYGLTIPSALQFTTGLYAIFAYVATGGGSPPSLLLSDMANGPVAIESGIAWNMQGGSGGLELSMATYGGIILTGSVSAVTSTSSFTVTLDTEYWGNAAGTDLTVPPLYVTFRNGSNHGAYSKITATGTISNSPTGVIPVTVTPAFPSTISLGDLVLISG